MKSVRPFYFSYHSIMDELTFFLAKLQSFALGVEQQDLGNTFKQPSELLRHIFSPELHMNQRAITVKQINIASIFIT